MKRILLVWALPVLGAAGLALVLAGAAPAPPPDTADLRAGKNLIATPVFTDADDQSLLDLFKGLRVSDVVDGMDAVGLQGVGLVATDIAPLWRDTEHYAHRIVGIAVTARYVPTNKPAAGRRSEAEYDQWAKDWYGRISPETFTALLRKGTVMVIDGGEAGDVGSIGSNNILAWKRNGCLGVVTNATARDTDEIAAERVPLYYKRPGRGIRPGRNELESVNRPVAIGGALVIPGDVIVADGDGVVVVPRGVAADVARYARKILDGDKAGRRGLYRQLGMPEDDSVK